MKEVIKLIKEVTKLVKELAKFPPVNLFLIVFLTVAVLHYTM